MRLTAGKVPFRLIHARQRVRFPELNLRMTPVLPSVAMALFSDLLHSLADLSKGVLFSSREPRRIKRSGPSIQPGSSRSKVVSVATQYARFHHGEGQPGGGFFMPSSWHAPTRPPA